MPRQLELFLCAALIAGPCMAKGAAASEAEKKSAMEAHVACLNDKAAELDDSYSDAGTIATAISSACTTTLLNVSDTYSKGGSQRLQRYTREQFVRGDARIATQVVLARRSKQKSEVN